MTAHRTLLRHVKNEARVRLARALGEQLGTKQGPEQLAGTMRMLSDLGVFERRAQSLKESTALVPTVPGGSAGTSADEEKTR